MYRDMWQIVALPRSKWAANSGTTKNEVAANSGIEGENAYNISWTHKLFSCEEVDQVWWTLGVVII